MASVTLRSGESQQELLRRFRKKVTRDGILRDARKKRFFVSKSEQRRVAKRKAIRRAPTSVAKSKTKTAEILIKNSACKQSARAGQMGSPRLLFGGPI